MSNCAPTIFVEKSVRHKGRREALSGCFTYFEYARQEFDLAADRSALVALCRDPDSIAKACGVTQAIASDKSSNNGLAKTCYVIGVKDEPVCKIGVSFNPIERFRQLQDATYKDLFLYGVLCSNDRHGELLESLAHKEAELWADWRKGEWFGIAAEAAFGLVLQQAHNRRLSVCDMGTWLRNLNARVRAMSKAGYRVAA